MSIKIIDDVLPQHVFDTLVSSLFHYDVPWYYCSTAYDEENIDIFGYSYHHTIMNDGKPNSGLCSLIEPMIMTALYKSGDAFDKLIRIRAGMITVTHESIPHKPHIDFAYPHKTGLIYLNESDGDTVIYKNKYDPQTNMIPQHYMESIKKDLVVDQIITPKPNRLVTFDGLLHHNSSTPTTVPRRIVINFNYTTKD